MIAATFVIALDVVERATMLAGCMLSIRRLCRLSTSVFRSRELLQEVAEQNFRLAPLKVSSASRGVFQPSFPRPPGRPGLAALRQHIVAVPRPHVARRLARLARP